jgi:hypothetical protein
MEGKVIFPSLHGRKVRLPSDLQRPFTRFIREKGWTPEEGVKILHAYGADALGVSDRTSEDVYHAWAAARTELAALRHRAYLADEAIRGLHLNITGLEASNAQFAFSLRRQETRRDLLRHTLAELQDHARERGIDLGSVPEAPAAAASPGIMEFWRAQRKAGR